METSNSPQTAVESSNTQQTVTATESSNTQSSAQAAGDSAASTQTAAAGETAAAPAYTPNWKFKANGKDWEVDEYFRPFIKDADSEKRFKDVFTKAYALDGYKSQYQKQLDSYNTLKKEYDPIKSNLSQVGAFLKKGDIWGFANAFGVNEDQIFKAVEARLEELQLPANQRQALEQARQQQWQQQKLEQEYQQMQEQYQSQAVETRTLQLDSVFLRPEISNYAKSWDSKMGEGSFRQIVIDEAAAYYHQTGVDLSPEQAIAHTLKKFGGWISQPGMASPTQATVTDAQVPGGQATVTPKQTSKGVPVIPHVAGKGASPVKKAIKSMDDLMERRAVLLAQSDG